MNEAKKNLRTRAETLLMLLGAVGLAIAGVVYADAWFGSRRAVADFKAAQAEVIETLPLVSPSASPDPPAETSRDDHALALLTITRLKLEVPVFPGTNKKTLNRGAGVVDGTSAPGTAGNIVISAHRDSFFRPLKDIRIGDVIELELRDGLQRFKVGETFITDPLDVSVLEPTQTPTLTLITCYPFYFVGFAPQRFIVRATLLDS